MNFLCNYLKWRKTLFCSPPLFFPFFFFCIQIPSICFLINVSDYLERLYIWNVVFSLSPFFSLTLQSLLIMKCFTLDSFCDIADVGSPGEPREFCSCLWRALAGSVCLPANLPPLLEQVRRLFEWRWEIIHTAKGLFSDVRLLIEI